MNKLKRFEMLRTLSLLLISLVIVIIAIAILADNPQVAIVSFLYGPISSVSRFGNVIEMMIPLVFTGLAVSVMFQANQFNMGADGIFFIGSIVAGLVATKLSLSGIFHPAVAILIAGLVGAVLNLIPAILKVKFGASELVSSLMLNYVWVLMGLFVINYIIKDPMAGDLASLPFKETATLTTIIPRTRIHTGLIIALLTSFASYIFLYKTKLGYKVRITGANNDFAKYSGINVIAIIILSQVVGGFIAGIGGGIEVLGMYNRIKWKASPGYGFDGVIIAALASNNPLYVPFAAFFMSYLRIGSDIMSINSNIPSELIVIMQAVIIVLIVSNKFLSKKRQSIIVEQVKELEVGEN